LGIGIIVQAGDVRARRGGSDGIDVLDGAERQQPKHVDISVGLKPRVEEPVDVGQRLEPLVFGTGKPRGEIPEIAGECPRCKIELEHGVRAFATQVDQIAVGIVDGDALEISARGPRGDVRTIRVHLAYLAAVPHDQQYAQPCVPDRAAGLVARW
jgi:hypothetical protein